MRKDYEKLFARLKTKEPPSGLLEKILFAIKQERESQNAKKLLLEFLCLLIISFIATPLSWTILVNQAESSGVSYFISSAISDLGTFFALWQDFSLAILESVPLIGLMAFAVSLGISVFSLRLFLIKRKILLGYLMQNFA